MESTDNSVIYRKISCMQQISFSIYHPSSKTVIPLDQEGATGVLSQNCLAEKICCACSRLAQCPYIYIELENILYGCICLKNARYLIIGPAANGGLTYSKKHDFMRLHCLTDQDLVIGSIRFYSFLELLSMIYFLEYGVELTGKEILEQNHAVFHSQTSYPCVTDWNLEKEKAMRLQDDELAELYHHTYSEELQWLECVKNGDVKGADRALARLMHSAGILSKNAVKHYKYLSVTAIVLCTRAAIEGGIDPAEAYALSDIFINKADCYEKLAEISRLPMEISEKYTSIIQADLKSRSSSNYVEQCRQYISSHYREGYSLKEISSCLGLNESYLSHLFVQNTGMSMKEYLNQVRTERAKNFLKYSNYSLVEISVYLGFSSQSYFGSVFKRIAGMTPQQYRNKYHVKEFE